MRTIGPDTRDENIERLDSEEFDVLIIGGGITGAGCALDAASRGFKTALIERDDFASGTSSKSSKLVHGGLRYLAQYDFGLTWEAAHERDLLSRIAPQLVRPLRFTYPVFRKGKEARFAALGLTAYDLLSAHRGVPRHRRASASLLGALLPPVDADRVVSAWTYWDASTDDARLVWEILRTAHAFGAVIANYVEARSFEPSRSVGACGAVAITRSHSRALTIRARAIVNATGVWAGEVGRLLDSSNAIAIRPAKGIHLVVPANRLGLGSAAIVPSAARDRRSLFAIPWLDRVVLGTTDTEYSGPLEQPAVTTDEVDYVLSGINKWMNVELRDSDIVASFAGLRPLRAGAANARTADLSRRHAVSVSPSGIISVTGGKLTTFRRMARDAIDAACAGLLGKRRSITNRINIGISRPPRRVCSDVSDLLRVGGLDPSHARRLVESFGDLAPEVARIATERAELGNLLTNDLSYIGAETLWAARHEMVVRLDDGLARRTRLSLLDRSGGLGSIAPSIIASELGWSDVELNEESSRYAAMIAAERGPAATPLYASRA
ncbi:MAG: glycerol-3-phosphate dehydrogenase/oxidase [Actinomycetota bacterium]